MESNETTIKVIYSKPSRKQKRAQSTPVLENRERSEEEGKVIFWKKKKKRQRYREGLGAEKGKCCEIK